MSRFDATVTPEGVKAANAAAEAAAANPDPAFQAGAGATAGSGGGILSYLDAPIEFIQSVYFTVMRSLWDIKYYLQRNAWYIVFLLFGGYMFKSYIFDPWYEEFQARRSYKAATNPARTSVLDSDLRRIRAAQQEEAQRKALEAAEEAKKKKAEELEKKRIKHPMEGRGGGGQRLGGEGPRRRRPDNNSGPSRSGYNPMNPWASGDTSGGYRAPRRNPNRGG